MAWTKPMPWPTGKTRRHVMVTLDGAKLRTAKFNEREHLVAPVVALMEGVIHASNADEPEFVPGEELERLPQAWNGRPAMLDHPELHGQKVSANAPSVLEALQLGIVFNARAEDKKLLLDAWLDIERVEKVGEKAVALLEALRAGKKIEVSVGVFVRQEAKSGVFNGKRFASMWRDIVPDH